MRFLHFLPYCALASAAYPPESSGQRNTNHIFNAIHSSMRQWGSSLNHNGMSFFIANVPKDTHFYHGTNTAVPVSGTEWLAFEPEHALLFARPNSRRPPPPPEEPDPPLRPPRNGLLNEQVVLEPPAKELQKEKRDTDHRPGGRGHLHTYKAKKDLRLLYVDGMSAGKTTNGTLDSQDYLLLGGSLPCKGFCEKERAEALCNLVNTKWKNRIDGIIRMEMGFEIIMCSFKNSLQIIGVSRIDRSTKKGHWSGVDGFHYYKSISDRFHGIGGGRVSLNYETFVTAFNYPIDLFSGHYGSDNILPRLNDIPHAAIAKIQEDVKNLILDSDDAEKSFDWQAVTDMIIQRYSSTLRWLISDKGKASNDLTRYILDHHLRPFIDNASRNREDEIARCIGQFFPDSQSREQSLASRVIHDAYETVCTSLFAASESADRMTDEGQEKASQIIAKLVEYLRWTSWKQCKACDDDQVCYVPIWPAGTLEDHKHPRCLNGEEIIARRGYWGSL